MRMYPKIMLGSLVVALAVVIVGVTIPACGNGSPNATATATTAFASHDATSTTTTAAKPGQDPRFVQKDVGIGDLNRVIGKGLPGHTAKQFTKSVLKVSGHSAQALAIYASAAHLWPNANNTKGLLVPDGTYLSQKGIMLWASLQGALTAKGTSSRVGKAPANWYNTGFSRGKFGRSATPGISGNRTSLIVTFKDGSKFVALRRCGNQALPGPGRLPVVPTDNHPRHPRLQPKDWRQDPAAQGNAPIGGGQNQDSGPGVYVKPSDMVHPGPTPYTPPPPPPPPPPTPPTPTAPPAGSTPDPATPPPPEPGAPTPDDPGGPAPPIPGG